MSRHDAKRVCFGPDQYDARAVQVADRIAAAGVPNCAACFVLAGIHARGVTADVTCFLDKVIRELTRRVFDKPEEVVNLHWSDAGPEYFGKVALDTLIAVGACLDPDDTLWIDLPDGAPTRVARTLRLVVDNAPGGQQ